MKVKKEVVNGCAYNEEIKIGYYIRTKDGNIGTIKHKITIHENDKFIRNEYRTSFNTYYYTDKQMQECGWKIKEKLIDLIEVNDYVNGYLVIAKSDDGYIEIAIGDDTEQGELLEQKT